MLKLLVLIHMMRAFHQMYTLHMNKRSHNYNDVFDRMYNTISKIYSIDLHQARLTTETSRQGIRCQLTVWSDCFNLHEIGHDNHTCTITFNQTHQSKV